MIFTDTELLMSLTEHHSSVDYRMMKWYLKGGNYRICLSCNKCYIDVPLTCQRWTVTAVLVNKESSWQEQIILCVAHACHVEFHPVFPSLPEELLSYCLSHMQNRSYDAMFKSLFIYHQVLELKYCSIVT